MCMHVEKGALNHIRVREYLVTLQASGSRSLLGPYTL